MAEIWPKVVKQLATAIMEDQLVASQMAGQIILSLVKLGLHAKSGCGVVWVKVGNKAKLSPASAGAWAELGNKISMANWHVSPKRKM